MTGERRGRCRSRQITRGAVPAGDGSLRARAGTGPAASSVKAAPHRGPPLRSPRRKTPEASFPRTASEHRPRSTHRRRLPAGRPQRAALRRRPAQRRAPTPHAAAHPTEAAPAGQAATGRRRHRPPFRQVGGAADAGGALLCRVRMTGVHLLQIDRSPLDEEPDAGIALLRRLVLPTLMDLPTAGDSRDPRCRPPPAAAGYSEVSPRSSSPSGLSGVLDADRLSSSVPMTLDIIAAPDWRWALLARASSPLFWASSPLF